MRDDLPEGWLEAQLGDVIRGFEAGRNLRCEGRQAGPGEYGVLKISSVTWGAFSSSENKALFPGDEPKPHERVRKGDLLITRANTSDLVGAVVLVGEDHPNLMLPDKILRVLPRDEIVDRRFLLHALRTAGVRLYFERNATGTSDSMRNLAQPKIAAAPIRFPALAEQHRIVTAVEALLDEVSRAKTRLSKVQLVLKRLRRSVLAAACAGDLTTGIDEASDPDTWIATTIGEVAVVGTGSTPLRTNPSFFASKGTPWVTSGATSLPIVTSANEYVTDAAILAHRLKKWPPGTLLVAMYGEGRTRGQVTELGIEATVNQACAAVLVNKSKANKSFVKLVLQANYLAMRDLAEGGNQPNLNLSKVKEFPLRLPPLACQQRIVQHAEALLGVADELEMRVQAALAHAGKLPHAVLAKAFSGELVPTEAELARDEGRDYESAEALVQRLEAGAQAGATPPKTRSASSTRSAKNRSPKSRPGVEA